ncbi:hypothetical protein, partial [Treponema berlinense]|uniref:hypothetical protein n=1 Tax=Treponema berlinense TaxID=225004 RepID=UPI0026EAB07C
YAQKLVYLRVRKMRTPCLTARITGMGINTHPCEFSCYAQKLVYLRVRKMRTPCLTARIGRAA